MKENIILATVIGLMFSATLDAGTFSFVNHTAQDRRVKIQLQGINEPVEDFGVAQADGGEVHRSFGEEWTQFLRKGLCIGKVEVSDGNTENMVRKPVIGLLPATYDEIIKNVDNPRTIKAIIEIADKRGIFALDGGIGVCPDRQMAIVPMLDVTGKENFIVILKVAF